MTRKIEWVRAAPEEVPGGGVERRRLFLAPDPRDHDPILLWGEDWFRHGAFDEHAHRGFATMSYVAEGSMSHSSSVGSGGALGPGDALWTVAGSGIVHDGQPGEDELAHGMQLWLNLPESHRMMPPAEVELPGHQAPRFAGDGFEGRVFAGRCNGVTGAAPIVSPFTFAEVRFSEGAMALDVAQDQAGFVYVLEGALSVEDHRVAAGCGARFSQGPGLIDVAAKTAGLALVAAGRPIGEPVVMDGPFVMGTREAIAQAYEDLETGRLCAGTDAMLTPR